MSADCWNEGARTACSIAGKGGNRLFNRYTSKQTYRTVPPSLGTRVLGISKDESADADFDARLVALSAAVSRECAEDGIRILRLTGPTCSGKTTAAGKLTEALEAAGLSVYPISLDDFYLDRQELEERARARGGTPDYDSADTLDLGAMEACVRELRRTGETDIPVFNFTTGNRAGTRHLAVPAGETPVFLFEGIQILYPQVDALLRQEGYYSFCVCPQSAIAAGGEVFLPNEIRLMRRLVRDVIYRAAAPSFTFFLWNSVRENEEKNIFPYIGTCNRTVDSTMPYEIGLLKPYLERYLTGEWVGDFWQEADGILARLADVQPVPDGLIQPDSLYKEFI